MNSKQRVLNTINFETADRIPLSFAANKFVREKLKAHLNLRSHLELLKYFYSDIVDLRDCVSPDFIGSGKPLKEMGNGILENYCG